MQLGKKTDIIQRMDKYAYFLNHTYKMQTILIAFMNHNYISEDNRSQFSYKIVCDSQGAVIKEEHDRIIDKANESDKFSFVPNP